MKNVLNIKFGVSYIVRCEYVVAEVVVHGAIQCMSHVIPIGDDKHDEMLRKSVRFYSMWGGEKEKATENKKEN